MSRKVCIEFVIDGKTESIQNIGSTFLEPKNKRGKKKKLMIDDENESDSQEEEKKKPEPTTKVSLKKEVEKKEKSKRGRKKKVVNEEESDETPAPKGKGKAAPPAKKSAPKGKKGKNKEDEDNDSLDSSRGENDSFSGMKDNMDFDDDMKLEDDDDIIDEDEIDEEDDEDDFGEHPGNMSTRNLLKMVKNQEDGDENSNDNLNIDLNRLTKRQKSQLKAQGAVKIEVEEPLLSLPDKKPRKRKNAYLTEEQQTKKTEIANKRKLMNQKLQEEHKKLTINKILNEAGRKQRMRKEKEEKDMQDKDNIKFRTLPEGEVGIRYISKETSSFLVLPQGYDLSTLFVDEF